MIPTFDAPTPFAVEVDREVMTMIAIDGYEPTDEYRTAAQYGRIATEEILIRDGVIRRLPSGRLVPFVAEHPR